MTTTPGGILSPIALDGVQLDQAGETEIAVREPSRALPQVAGGGRREERVWWGAPALAYPTSLVPERRLVIDVRVQYSHARAADRATIDELVAAPGVHELAPWKAITITWLGDGSRDICWAPWTRADELLSVPSLLQGGKADPQVKITRAGTALTVSSQDTATIDGVSSPAAGLAWWETAGQRIRLPSVPASGERVYCTWFPILAVYLGTEDDRRRYTGQRPLAEPRDLVFVGAG